MLLPRDYTRATLLSCLLIAAGGQNVIAQDRAPADSLEQVSSADPIDPLFDIELFELTGSAEESARELRAFRDRVKAQRQVQEIQRAWAPMESVDASLTEETESVLKIDASKEWLSELQRKWRVHIAGFDVWSEILRARSQNLEESLKKLDQIQNNWESVRVRALQRGVPDGLTERIDFLLNNASEIRPQVETRLIEVLDLQGQVALRKSRAFLSMARLGENQSAVLLQQFEKDSASILSLLTGDRESVSTVDQRGGGVSSDPTKSRFRILIGYSFDYLKGYKNRMGWHFLLFLGLVVVFRSMRKRLSVWMLDDPGLESPAKIIELSVSTALVIALLSTALIYPIAPLYLLGLAALISIIPTLRVLLHVSPHETRYAIYGVVLLTLGFFFSRSFLDEYSVAQRLAMIFVASMGVAAYVQLLRRGGAREVLAESIGGRLILTGARAGIGLMSISILANVSGYYGLALTVVMFTTIGAYFGLYFYVGALVIDALVITMLRTNWLQSIRAVGRNTELLTRRLTMLIHFAAGAGWIFILSSALGIFIPLWEGILALLNTEWSIGAASISPADILTFIVTLWAAILISRFIRFILEEDILTRMDLPRGVPTTISRLGYYVLVAIGTLFAFSAAGVPLDRLSLLAGAFGVGIGFGLQDVVNNFVSGIILMFERPIKEGDIIEFGTKSGIVDHIGIRSSIVRTWDGADINVPNARLISNEVTNWTLNDELRRIDLSIKVEYDSDPLLVNEILLQVANEHERTMEDPAPAVVFLGFGENALEFSLQAWSSGEYSWLTIRTELYFSVYRELAAAGIRMPVPQRSVRMQTQPETKTEIQGPGQIPGP